MRLFYLNLEHKNINMKFTLKTTYGENTVTS